MREQREEREAMVTSTELAKDFARSGYCVAKGLFTAEEVTEIREVFQEVGERGPIEGLQDTTRLNPEEPLARYPRMMHPHRFAELPVGPVALKYMLDHRVEAVLRELMGEEPLATQSMFYFKPPGSRGQALHQDNYYLQVRPGTCIAAWTAVDDTDVDNGCLMVVPRSHTMSIVCPERSHQTESFTTEHVPVPEGLGEMPLPLAAGDVLLFNGSLIHGSYPNRSTDRFRRTFICHYLPTSSTELSKYYRPILRFDGEIAAHVGEATGGGPCGEEWSAPPPGQWLETEAQSATKASERGA